jgi:hypothetical protein
LVLPSVLALIFLITILGFTAAHMVESQTQMGLRYTGREKALHYAEAGLHKYLWHLNKDSRYYERDVFGLHDAWPGRVLTSAGAIIYEAPAGSPGHPDEGNVHIDGRYYLEIVQPGPGRPMVTIRSTGWPAADPTNRVTVEVETHKRRFSQNIFVTNTETLPGTTTRVWWITGDRVEGPLHTNGQLFIDGAPVFEGAVTYSGADPHLDAGSSPTFPAGYPQRTAVLAFPASNSQLRIQAQLNGYYFTGRTEIRLNDNRLLIRNRGGSLLDRPLPPNGVIYVDGTAGTDKWGLGTGNVFVSGTLNGRLTIAAANDIFITGRDPTNYSFTAAAVTGGLRYANTNFTGANLSDDMLGLVANRWVRILHDDWPSATGRTARADVAPHDITIHAAVFALDWAFEYERFSDPPVKGTITLVGSLTQRNRGAVGTFSGATRLTGYLKDYRFDPRMAYDAPPHFLEPTNAGWEITAWRLIENPTP